MATILGNLQMLPVPTVDPRHVNTSPMPDENLFCNVRIATEYTAKYT